MLALKHLLPILALVLSSANSHDFEIFFKWKEIDYQRPTDMVNPDFNFPDAAGSRDSFDYIPRNNIPMGVTHHNGKLFITMPRRRPGIPATISYVSTKIARSIKSPNLIPYPTLAINSLNPQFRADTERIVSVYRTKVDACNRLWFVDTGMLEYPDNQMQVQQPSIWVIDLQTDQRVRRFEFPENIVSVGSGLPSITVDVDANSCNDAYAYVPDLLHQNLYVYSFRENRAWTFHHNYFSFDPLMGDLDIAGQRFEWNDGIFSITLGNRKPDGFRDAYFHAMASISEFKVSTKVLRNETESERSYHGTDFQHIGKRGPLKQSTMHEFDPRTGVIFYNEISKYGIGCWNTNKPLTETNVPTIFQSQADMIYPSDLTIDSDGVIWAFSNTMPVFIYSQLDWTQYNFKVWRLPVQDAVQGTTCQR